MTAPLSVAEAHARLMRLLAPLGTEEVPLAEASEVGSSGACNDASVAPVSPAAESEPAGTAALEAVSPGARAALGAGSPGCSASFTIRRPGANRMSSARSRLRTLQNRLNLKNKPIIKSDDR